MKFQETIKVNLVKIAGSKTLLSPQQAQSVLDHIKELKDFVIDFRGVSNCTLAFVNTLIYNHNKRVKFDKYKRLVFINIKEPMIAKKIQNAMFDYSDKEESKRIIKHQNKLLKDILRS